MAFAVLQSSGVSAASTSVTFGSATTAGSCLIVVAVSNIAAGACTAGGQTLMGGIYSPGHNGDWTGIWYLPPTANPGGITSATVTGAHAVGYLEVTGTAGYPQILAGQGAGGNATATTSYTMTNPGASASNFTVYCIGYDVSNSSTPYGDGTTGTKIISLFGQFGYTTSAGNATSGTIPSGTYDWCAVSFAPASAGGLTRNLMPAAGVYRGPCGGKLQDSNTSTVAQSGIVAYETWLGRNVSFVLDYLMETPTTWAQFTGAQLDQTSGSFSLLSQWGTLPSRWTMCLGLSACCGKSIGTGASTWAGEAAGTNDAYWTTLGTNLVNWGYGNAVIRLGREFNGNWYNWAPPVSGDTAANYIAGYQHIVTLLRGITGSSFTFMWNPTLGTMTSPATPAEIASWYPGDTYVDSIGLDFYDWGTYPTLTTAPYAARTTVQQQANFTAGQQEQDGLNGWAVFAAKRTPAKPLALPEWGLQQWLTGSNYIGGGDDPSYITQMATVAQYCTMQAMWEDTGMGLFDTDACPRRVVGAGGDGIHVPLSRAAYLSLLGATAGAATLAAAGTVTATATILGTINAAANTLTAAGSVTAFAAVTGPYVPPIPVNVDYPLWTNGMTWTSQLQRQFGGGAAVWDANTSTGAVSPLGGVFPGPAGPLQVTPLAVPGMGVLVNAGYCAVPHPVQGSGVYLFGLTQQGTLTVAANPATVARTDIVIARIYDLTSASSYCDVEIISGTPGAGRPATPAVAVLLSTVTVAPSATVISSGNITDQRTFTVAPGGVLPATASTAPPLAAGQVMMNTSTGALETLAPPVAYTKTFYAATSWVAPFTGLVYASLIGGGAGGGGGFQDVHGYGTTQGGAGGGGGEWAGGLVPVTIGHSYPVNIGEGGFRGDGGNNFTTSPQAPGAGAAGTATTFTGDGGATVTANGGLGGAGEAQTAHPDEGGLGGSGSTSAGEQPGGGGGAGAWASQAPGGGGGGSGSPGAPGGPGGNGTAGGGSSSGGGGGTGPGGGTGGPGGHSSGVGAPGTVPGGGGGGGYADSTVAWTAGGNGANGQATLTWTIQPATLTPVQTKPSGDGTTPGEWISQVNTDTGRGINTGYGSPYGWGIGFGRGDGTLNVDGYILTAIQVPITADGHTDYAIDVTWGIMVPEAATDSAAPNIPWGRCAVVVTIDVTTILDTVWLNCAAAGGVLYPADAGSFTVYTSSKNGTTPGAGDHTVALAIQTSATNTGNYSGAHVGDLASVGTSPHPFGGTALPSGYTASLTQENCYLRVTGISS